MFRLKPVAFFAAMVLLVMLDGTSRAGFTLIGPAFGGVTVNPSTPGGLPGNTTVATGIISSSNFVTWSQVGPDGGSGYTVPNNILTGIVSTTGVPIAAVTLVSNSSSNPTQVSPTPLPTGANALQRRTNGYSFSGEFSSNEAVLTANAANSAMIIDFAVPVSAAGFRVQADTAGTNNTFFLQGFNDSGSNYSPVTPLYNGLQVTTASFSGAEAAPFYGIEGSTPTDTFTRLWIGFSGPTSDFTISTLEVLAPAGGGGGSPGTGAVPAPPTCFAAAIGFASLRWLRRRKTQSA
jgi:hypothetical protein